MTLINAVEAVMLYATYSDEDINIVTALLQKYTGDPLPYSYKSVRLENDRSEAEKLRRLAANEKTYRVSIADTKVEYTCLKYIVRSEDVYRLAVCSERCVHPFTVRVFTETAPFNRFKANHMIHVCEEFSFHELRILRYESEDSKVVRYAVFAPGEYTFSRAELKSSIVTLGRGSTTSHFV